MYICNLGTYDKENKAYIDYNYDGQLKPKITSWFFCEKIERKSPV
jgi:hypothetical protein